ncbi:MAG TPA: hypothetical protein VHF47_08255, partial [Acidimicrobiales bacterium]|nr:hypothetical protein [Acidimicrobiales bacterium]
MHSLRRVFLGVVVLAAIAVLFPRVDAPAAGPKPLFEQIGTLERFGADARAALGQKFVPFYQPNALIQRSSGSGIIIPAARQLWQLHPSTDGTQQTGIVVRDLDSLQITRSFVFPDIFSRANIDETASGDWMHAIDATSTRLWIASFSHHFVYEFDLRSSAFKKRPIYGSLAPGNAKGSIIIGGMTYDPYHDDLLLLYGGPGANSLANTNAFLYRLDVSVAPPTTYNVQDMQKMYRIRSCTAPVNSTDAGTDTSSWSILVTERYLYVPCQRAGHTVIVVRMERPDGAEDNERHGEDVTAGPVYGDAVFADQASGRLFVTTY